MERPELIPHLTPKERVDEKLDAHLAKLKARVAKIQERMVEGVNEKNPIIKIPVQTRAETAPFDAKMKRTGEHLEKEYVLVDGHMVLKEFAEE